MSKQPVTVNSTLDADRVERILSGVERRFLQPCELREIYSLVSEKAHEIIVDGITATSMLDDAAQTMSFAAYHGLDIPLLKISEAMGFDPTQKTVSLADMTEAELKLYRSGSLEKLEEGLYALLTRHVPKPVCLLVEKLMRVTGIYTIGFTRGDQHFGGLIILARSDISSCISALERLVHTATLVVERKRMEINLLKSDHRLRTFIDFTSDWEYWVKPDGRHEYDSPSCKRISGYDSAELQAVTLPLPSVWFIRMTGRILMPMSARL